MEHKAQSTVEYIVLVTAVIAVIFFMIKGPGTNSGFQNHLENADFQVISAMKKKAVQMYDSTIGP